MHVLNLTVFKKIKSMGEMQVKIAAVLNPKVGNFIFSGKMPQAGNIQCFYPQS